MNFSLTQSVSRTGYLKSQDQTSLFFRHYPVVNAKAKVFLVHGFGEHSGRYSHVIERLNQENFEVLTIDLRGHGHSAGKPGFVEAFEDYERDVNAALEYMAKNLLPGKKLFVLAHSMGALISLRVSTRTSVAISGMVLSCPLLCLTMPVPSWKKWAVFAMAHLIPNLRMSANIKGRQLSHDEAIAKAYDEDPLVLKSIAIRTFWEIFKAYKGMTNCAAKKSPPFLMQLGGKDSVVDSRASELWFNQIDRNGMDATLKIYPKLQHEIYNEIDRKIPIDDAMAWLNARA